LGDYNNLIKLLNSNTDAYFLTFDKSNRFNILAVLTPNVSASQRSQYDEYKKSNEFYAKTLDVIQRSNRSDPIITSTCLNNMSENFQRLADYQKSIELLSKSMQVPQGDAATASLMTADQYSRLAENLQYLDEHEKSVEFARKALSVYAKFSSEDNDRLSSMGEAHSYRNIGVSQIQLGNKKAAIDGLEKAVQVYRTKVYSSGGSSSGSGVDGESQPCVADACHHLGVAYQMPPKPDLKKSLEQFRKGDIYLFFTLAFYLS
jgi:tetratricopeptide (TPR) repeat protein